MDSYQILLVLQSCFVIDFFFVLFAVTILVVIVAVRGSCVRIFTALPLPKWQWHFFHKKINRVSQRIWLFLNQISLKTKTSLGGCRIYVQSVSSVRICICPIFRTFSFSHSKNEKNRVSNSGKVQVRKNATEISSLFFGGQKNKQTHRLLSRPNVFSSYIFNYLSRLKTHFWILSFSLNEMRCIFSDSVIIHFFYKKFHFSGNCLFPRVLSYSCHSISNSCKREEMLKGLLENFSEKKKRKRL